MLACLDDLKVRPAVCRVWCAYRNMSSLWEHAGQGFVCCLLVTWMWVTVGATGICAPVPGWVGVGHCCRVGHIIRSHLGSPQWLLIGG